jgi:hypothetical protein
VRVVAQFQNRHDGGDAGVDSGHRMPPSVAAWVNWPADRSSVADRAGTCFRHMVYAFS